jgi:3-hydroxyacyl-CoA dehydrogenase
MSLTTEQETSGLQSNVVRIRRSGTVGVLVIDNPPVNASSAQVRSGLLAGIEALSTDAEVSAVVLIGAGKNFVSGSDLQEFNSPVIPQPELPQVIDAIRRSVKPVVAAISGATLGGGLELALACDYRVALGDTVVGLPETTLGMIPGAGGTQRVLHALGPARAIALIASGNRYPVRSEEVANLVDHVTDADLEAAAVEFALTVTGKRDVLHGQIPAFEAGAVEAAASKAIAATGGRPQVIAAVGAVLAGLALPVEKALVHERNEFTRLRNGDESAALRHVFFARRAVAKANRPTGPVRLQRVAVVGSGTMGRGIARTFLDHGLDVVIHDERPEALTAAREHLESAYRKQTDAGQLSPDEAESRIQRVTYARTLEELAGADLYIEAVFEDVDVKRDVLRRLEPVAAGAILATNTSYLNIELLADALSCPEKLIGLHFFSPAHRTPVLEVVHGRRTAQDAMDLAFTAAKTLGKVAIRSAVGEGFIGNRVFNAYRKQCELLLEEGALPEQVDAALRQFGFAMGPFAVADMSGLDIAWRMRQRTAADRDPAQRYPDVADALCERGWFGQKSGRGWYRYGEDGRTPLPDPDVTQLILESSDRKGILRQSFTFAEIQRRVLLAMANESALILEDRIADRASDIDLMLILGYGFPEFRGGPTMWARQQDPAELHRALDALEEVTGAGFRRGDLTLLTR